MNNSPLLPVYRRANLTMESGVGAYLFDTEGKKYLDFASGIAVNVLGHSHPALLKAMAEQSTKLWHCSNLYSSKPLEEFAAKLIENAEFADKVFFCSSGTEAVECAIKMARRYHYAKGNIGKGVIIAADGAFHGRSMAALSACSHIASRQGFEPLLKGFSHVKFNDVKSLKAAINPHVGAIMLEPIQGEGGVKEHSKTYLTEVRKICDENDILLIFDEIQCGYGRTGVLFTHTQYGVTPDIVTIAKGIGGGFPLAACLSTNNASSGMTRGTHGSTYGSNPLACAVGLAVLEELLSGKHIKNAAEIGGYLKAELQRIVGKYPELYQEVRGKGLMIGLVINDDSDARTKYELAENLRENGLLTAPAVTNVIRILPPLIITKEHADEAIEILDRVSSEA